MRENADIRIKSGSALCSESADYFDAFLLEHLPARNTSVFRYAMNCSYTLNRKGCGVPAGWIVSRLLGMCEAGLLCSSVRKKKSIFFYDNRMVKKKTDPNK